MEPGPYEHVPLTDEEKDLLRNIYRTRLRYMVVIYASLFLLVFSVMSGGFIGFLRLCEYVINESINGNFGWVRGLVPWSLYVLWLSLFLISTGLFYLLKRALPYRSDARVGVKERIPFRVIRKEFDLLGEYYVALDDPDYLHHLLDEQTYYNCNVGDFVYVYRCPKSKFIFEGDGRMTLL